MMTNQKNNSALVLKKMLNGPGLRQKFDDVLGKGAGAFSASVLSLVNATPALQEADPMTILGAAMTAATMKLPINPNLGFAYIIPYKNIPIDVIHNIALDFWGFFRLKYKG
ncbi:recombinase RecT [Selenomonas montiformis]|nr:recombinase RecT [Selenomonas montiformis]